MGKPATALAEAEPNKHCCIQQKVSPQNADVLFKHRFSRLRGETALNEANRNSRQEEKESSYEDQLPVHDDLEMRPNALS